MSRVLQVLELQIANYAKADESHRTMRNFKREQQLTLQNQTLKDENGRMKEDLQRMKHQFDDLTRSRQMLELQLERTKKQVNSAPAPAEVRSLQCRFIAYLFPGLTLHSSAVWVVSIVFFDFRSRS